MRQFSAGRGCGEIRKSTDLGCHLGSTGVVGPVEYIIGATGATGVGITGATGPAGPSSSFFEYKINANSTSGYPGNSYISYNNSVQTSATKLYVSHLTQNNTDIDLFLSFLSVSQKITIQDTNTSSNYQTWTISAAPIAINSGLQTSYLEIPVTLTSSGGLGSTGFSNNHYVIFAVVTGALGPTGATGPSASLSSSSPQPLGQTASAGSSSSASKSDHVHQRDTDIIIIPIGDETTALTSGTSKKTFRMPFNAVLTGVRASVNTAPSGSTLIFDINESGTTLLSTKLSIDSGEKTSMTAASPAVISDTSLAEDSEISIDIDQVGSVTAGSGAKIQLHVRRQ